MGKIFEAVFPVRQGERRLTLLLLAHNLFAVGAFVAGRSVRDALFLAHADRSVLAWMYVASAAAVAAIGFLYAPLAARVRRDRMALCSALVFAGFFAIAWFAERRAFAGVYEVLYVYVEVMGALVLVQFWTLANELFHAREAKRLYGIIGSGGTIANILIGLSTARIATHFGASAILWLCAVLLLGCAVFAALSGGVGRQRMFARAAAGKAPSSRGRMSGGMSRVFTTPHLRLVAVLTVVTFFTTNIVDFQFKVIAADSFGKDQLAAYFGYFSAVVGVLALGLQLFGTGRILNRAGVIGALSILPVALGLGSLSVAVVGGLWAASAMKGADTLFRYSINDATSQILYLPVPPNGRASAKAFIDSVVKPLSIGAAGLALIGYRAVSSDPSTLAWVSVAMTAVWLGIVLALRPRYVRSLQDNLRNRRLDLASAPYRVQDGSTQRVLTRALESGDPREVLNALDLLPHLENVVLDNRVEALLEHPMRQIRIAALDYYKRRQAIRFANSIFRRFEDDDAGVRAAAVDAFCSIGKDKAVRSVKAYLQDPDPAVRSAAVAGMIRYGGLDGILMAAEALKQLISHSDAEMRVHAARVLGAVGVSNFYQPVLELMADDDARVRREAIHAAGLLKSPEFVIPLIYRTRSPDTHREAVEALSQFGPSITGTLGKVMANAHEAQPIRSAAAKVLGRIGTPEAIALLCRQLDEPDEDLRNQLYRSLARAVKGKRGLALDRKVIRAALDREFHRAYQTLMDMDALGLGAGPGPHTPRKGPAAAAALLSSAMAEKVAATERRIFTLLAVLYPEAEMERIYSGIHDAAAEDASRRRANAVELLENLLERDLKRKLLPLSDDVPRSEKLRAIADVLEVQQRRRAEVIASLCRDDMPWVRACAIHYAVEHGLTDDVDAITESLKHPSPVVREIALLSLSRLWPQKAAALAEAALGDEALVVRRQAARMATRRVAGATG
ncbi:MAG: MFS transporter [Myxococcaceae bacterium]|nr:MFS transporter [Myxococcaceae bacterium]